METSTITHWTPIFFGMIGGRSVTRSRYVRIDRGRGSLLRVITTALGLDEEIAIIGEIPSELEERLVVYGDFTDAQASEIIRKVMFR